MAKNKPPEKPPGMSKDILMDETETKASDRPKRINSLHRSIEELSKEENRKRLQISTEIDALTKQQQKLTTQLNLENEEFVHDTAKAYGEITKGIGDTIKNLAVGVKNITTETAKATTNAINQYGKAISEDIGINKTNTIAMSLAQATPIYGYFAAKFMETDVFKNATAKIRENIGSAVSSGLRSIGSKIGIGKKRKEIGTVADQELVQNIPKAARGGYVEKGGLVEVHAGEIIAPMEEMQKEQRKTNKDLVTMFMENLEEVNAKKPWQEELNQNIKEMKEALIGSQDNMMLALKKTLREHPVFRKLMFVNDVFQTALVKPIRWLFAIRGGYGSEARKATKSDNVFERILQMLMLQYTRGMPKLDAIAYYNKVAAETVSGKELKPPKEKLYTKFSKIKAFLTGKKKKEKKEEEAGMILSYIAGDEETLKRMKEAGITKLSDLLPWNFAKKIGATKENLKARAFESGMVPGFIKKRMGGEGVPMTPEEKQKELEKQWAEYQAPKTLQEKNQEIIEKQQSDLEKMADGISVLNKTQKASLKEDKESHKKTKKYRRQETSWKRGLFKRLKKIGGGIWKWVMVGLSAVKSAFQMVWGGISSFLNLFIGGAAAPIVTGLLGLLGSATFWGIVGAGLIGIGIGTVINKYLINPLIEWWENRKKKKTQAVDKRLDEMRRETLKDVRGLDVKKSVAATRRREIYGDITAAHAKAKYQRQRRLSIFPGITVDISEADMQHITAGQQEFIFEHEKQYLQYSAKERRELRAKWIKENNGGFRDRNFLEDPHKYGKKREEAFLNYLRKKGKKLTDEEKAEMIRKRAEEISKTPVKKPPIAKKPAPTTAPTPPKAPTPTSKGYGTKPTYWAAAYWRDPKTGEAFMGIGSAVPRTNSSNSYSMAKRKAKLLAKSDLARKTGRRHLYGLIQKTYKSREEILPPEKVLPPFREKPEKEYRAKEKYKTQPKVLPSSVDPESMGSESTMRFVKTKKRTGPKPIYWAAAYWRDPKTGKAWMGIGSAVPRSHSSTSYSMARQKAKLKAKGDLLSQFGKRRAYLSGLITKVYRSKEDILPPEEVLKASEPLPSEKAEVPEYVKLTTEQQSAKAKMAQTPASEATQNKATQNNQVTNISNSSVSSASQNINAGGGGKVQTPAGGFSSGPAMGASVVHSNIR